MQGHLEFGDNSEIPTTSANGPVKIRILVGASPDLVSIGEDHGCSKNVVATEAELTHDRTDPSSEKKSSDSYGGTLTQHCGDSCLGGRSFNRAAQHSSPEAGGFLVTRNDDVADAGHVEYEARLATGITCVAMASAPNGCGQAVGLCKIQAGGDVQRVRRAHDECRMRIKFCRISLAKVLVF